MSENTSGLQKENAESQARIRQLEAELAGARAREATADNRYTPPKLWIRIRMDLHLFAFLDPNT